MTAAADLLSRLDHAVRQAVAAGEIGVAKSIRLHVGAPAGDAPNPDTLLGLADFVFGCARMRVERTGVSGSAYAMLCVWEHGQIATITTAVDEHLLLLLTVLGQSGALHFQQRET